MSEPLGVEELARLREVHKSCKRPGRVSGACDVLDLLDHIDRLTEALEAADCDAAFCRRCGLSKRADMAGVLCDPPFARMHDFPRCDGAAMSEPLGVEERARLRTLAENREQIFPSQVLSLLDEVDRLTEALEAAERKGAMWVSKYAWDQQRERAERAEADLAAKDEQIECLVADRKTEHDGRHRAEQALADEKRRHAELRAGVEKLADAWEGSHAVGGNLAASLRALLDTATEEASDSDV